MTVESLRAASKGGRSPRLVIAGTSALVAVAAGLAWWLAPTGQDGPDGHARPGPPGGEGFHLLLAIAVVLGVARLGGLAARWCRAPAVLGEIAVCLLLGPSLLGAVAPDAMDWLFPDEALQRIGGLAQLGLVLFMVAAGAELDLGLLRTARRSLLTVGYAAVGFPLAAGLLVAVPTYGAYAGAGVGFPVYAVFLGAVLSVTALPVLARILSDTGLMGTPIASFALGTAAATDLVVWSLAAVCLGLAGTGTASGATVVLLAVLFVAVMVTAVRVALRGVLDASGPAGREGSAAALTVVMAGGLAAAAATDAIGVHAAFGAFVFGAVLPRRSPGAMRAARRLGRFSAVALLPLFFLEIGMRTDLTGAGGGAAHWLWCLAFITVAVATKLGGATLAARADRWPWNQALALGLLLNCRGVTELILLRIGVDGGLISPGLFGILVIMTLVTTAMTAPQAGRLTGAGAAGPHAEGGPAPPPATAGKTLTPTATVRGSSEGGPQ
jgi:Kef-type K+ transport system membrane component KefB